MPVCFVQQPEWSDYNVFTQHLYYLVIDNIQCLLKYPSTSGPFYIVAIFFAEQALYSGCEWLRYQETTGC